MTTNDKASDVLRDTAIHEKCEEDMKVLKKTLKLTRNILKETKRKNKILEKRLQRKIFKIFNEDQQIFLTYRNQRGATWSEQTISKALKLYVACGQKGYDEIRRQNLPYPSIRTLQHRIQGLKF